MNLGSNPSGGSNRNIERKKFVNYSLIINILVLLIALALVGVVVALIIKPAFYLASLAIVCTVLFHDMKEHDKWRSRIHGSESNNA